jgi:hypothetical protein
MKSITCMCETTFDVDIKDEIDLDADPGSVERIRSGDFMNFPCPNCGKALKPEFPVTLLSGAKKLKLLMIPEVERLSFYRGKYPVPSGSECVIGFPELLDRIRAVYDGFDHRAIEIMKYIYLSKAQESDPEAQARVFYHGLESGSLCFHVHGLSSGNIAIVKAPRQLYDMTVQDLPSRTGQEPFSTILKAPYVSVNHLEIED